MTEFPNLKKLSKPVTHIFTKWFLASMCQQVIFLDSRNVNFFRNNKVMFICFAKSSQNVFFRKIWKTTNARSTDPIWKEYSASLNVYWAINTFQAVVEIRASTKFVILFRKMTKIGKYFKFVLTMKFDDESNWHSEYDKHWFQRYVYHKFRHFFYQHFSWFCFKQPYAGSLFSWEISLVRVKSKITKVFSRDRTC